MTNGNVSWIAALAGASRGAVRAMPAALALALALTLGQGAALPVAALAQDGQGLSAPAPDAVGGADAAGSGAGGPAAPGPDGHPSPADAGAGASDTTGASSALAPPYPTTSRPSLADDDMPVITRSGPGAANSLLAAGNAPEPRLPPGEASPVVVELFTSQGCSSCPPTDAMVAGLAGSPAVLPLSFHVDYWDYLGWADSFASPEFSARQEAYARASGERSVYTPQVVVGGQDTALSLRPAELMALIDAHRAGPAAVAVRHSDDDPDTQVLELFPLSDPGGRMEVMLIRFAPQRTVEVKAGENRGRRIAYRNVVLDMQRLAVWNGVAPLRLTVRPGTNDDRFAPDTRHAILVQRLTGGKAGLPGPIMAAALLD